MSGTPPGSASSRRPSPFPSDNPCPAGILDLARRTWNHTVRASLVSVSTGADTMTHDYLVRNFMTSPAKSIARDARLLDAALVLRSTGFRRLPIVEGERLVGIVTVTDMLGALLRFLATPEPSPVAGR